MRLITFAARIGMPVLGLLVLAGGRDLAQADTITLFADRDGYTGFNLAGGDAPGSGITPTFLVGRNNTNFGSALHFDTSSLAVGTTINSATLELYQSDGDTSRGLTLLSIVGGGFTEAQLSFEDAQTLFTFGGNIGGSASTTLNAYNNLSGNALTQEAQQWVNTPGSNLGLFVAQSDYAANNVFKTFVARVNDSGLSSEQPRLVLDVASVPEPGAIALLATCALTGAGFLVRRKK